jgi:hypothetical protein
MFFFQDFVHGNRWNFGQIKPHEVSLLVLFDGKNEGKQFDGPSSEQYESGTPQKPKFTLQAASNSGW